ncbi:MAG: response regulator transcription factor [Microcoleus sp. PH2017_10_PVI_O_A]|uniref:response regulator n=1 Tax=unclassified Microcoleus TaxID=2642155 RepID=UPI001DB22E55|nr:MULTISPECIES: response regulator [unclassified Microcoleus]TAE73621.1 MAG: response regulator [Oscillatoriales cyanobacterium]MCC3409933.1 response regulator transcription factor [Microcoleus sp. PH2017_10_PVI_O_A]MCC3464181.1 response regulator transcription factor [Microcoleus sp. PH2017_11_PCY_U_A]MCC3482526.1 response regulator transcription factor [Microcoleus sp. PH2017_12_PCY_D_A]MCC3531958.1 response regulator transcription factor [Microcoleus sp. PH2017_21_RUC_O_A]
MTGNSIILAVDRNQRNLQLLAQFLNKEGYHTIAADSFEEFARAIGEPARIGMALVDISGFDPRIWDCCEQLRNHQIPFLILSPRQSAAIGRESLSRGARSMLVKPLIVRDLLSIVHSLLGEPA